MRPAGIGMAPSLRGGLPVPGRHVTDCQMRLYMTLRRTQPVPIAAARAGFSTATACRIEGGTAPLHAIALRSHETG